VHAAVAHQRVRAGEVDELEQAVLRGGLGEPSAAQTVLVDGDHLAGLDLADERCADDVEGRGLRGDHPAPLEPAEHQRSDALRVPRGVQGVLVHPHEREGAAQVREDLYGVLLEAHVRVMGEQRGDQAGVVGRCRRLPEREVELPERAGEARDPGCEVPGVGEVAVVSEGDRPGLRRPERRLRVVPGAGAGRGVARVPDGQVTLEGLQRRLVEDL
jgi:hypothetical protein